MYRSVALNTILLGFSMIGLACKSAPPGPTREEQVEMWLWQMPPFFNPPPPRTEQFHYASLQDWAEAGRRIDGIEDVLINRYRQAAGPRERVPFIRVLAYVGSEKSAVLLISEATNTTNDEQARQVAVMALGYMGGPQATSALRDLAQSTTEEPSFRWLAACELGDLRAAGAGQVAQQLLTEVGDKLSQRQRSELATIASEQANGSGDR